MVALEPGPTLERIVMPRTACQIFVDMKIAMGQNIKPGALLVTDQYRHRVLKFLPEANVEHAGVERLSPHTHVEPARARKRSGGCAGENQVGSSGEHGCSILYVRDQP